MIASLPVLTALSWVPTVNVGELEFVSKRLRNYQYHPVWGFMADQAWLK